VRAQHGGQRIEIGVGAQHEHAVEPGVFVSLAAIDREVTVADFPGRPVLLTSALSPRCNCRSSAARMAVRSAIFAASRWLMQTM
jgi:hypothetical protein